MDPVCVLDVKGYCTRHKGIHAGKMRELALAETPEGEKFRLYQDKVTSGEIFKKPFRAPTIGQFTIGIGKAQTQPTRKLPNAPPPPKPPKGWGPGTKMRMLLKDMKIIEKPGCGCVAKMNEMDEWGVEGCRTRMDHLIKFMEANAENYGWEEQKTAAIEALKMSLYKELKLSDSYYILQFRPLPILLRIAIDRAEVEGEPPSRPGSPASA